MKVGEEEHFVDAANALPDSIDDDMAEVSSPPYQDSPVVRLQCEDFGGNFVLPYFGKSRPGRDYYTSNLTMYNFVVSDLASGHNYVYLYDERAMGKGCDALCSLRWNHHLKMFKKFKESNSTEDFPDTLYLIMDNCVGQNKSQVYLIITLNFFYTITPVLTPFLNLIYLFHLSNRVFLSLWLFRQLPCTSESYAIT